MFDKVVSGTPISRSPARSARWLNAVSDATAYYHQNLALGKGVKGVGLKEPTDIVKVRNLTGENRARGATVQLGGYLLSEINSRALFFEGNTPAEPLHLAWAILLQDTPSNKIAPAQMSGVCVALVDIVDEEHKFASPTDGQHYLTSSGEGPIELLSLPDGTGQQEIIVRLLTPQSRSSLRGYLLGPLAKGGSAEIAVLGFDVDDNEIDTGRRETIWALGMMNSGDAAIPIYTYVSADWSYEENRYLLGNAHCEAEAEGNLPPPPPTTLAGGSASSVGTTEIEAGSASSVGDTIYDAGGA